MLAGRGKREVTHAAFEEKDSAKGSLPKGRLLEEQLAPSRSRSLVGLGRNSISAGAGSSWYEV